MLSTVFTPTILTLKIFYSLRIIQYNCTSDLNNTEKKSCYFSEELNLVFPIVKLSVYQLSYQATRPHSVQIMCFFGLS